MAVLDSAGILLTVAAVGVLAVGHAVRGWWAVVGLAALMSVVTAVFLIRLIVKRHNFIAYANDVATRLTLRYEQLRHEGRYRAREERASMREELASKREELASTGEELASKLEGLASTREEVASAREALTKAREELTKAREEVTKAREELTKVREGRYRAREDQAADWERDLVDLARAVRSDAIESGEIGVACRLDVALAPFPPTGRVDS